MQETGKNFAIIGVAGYIAPRHLKAIKDTGSNLVAALDPHDSVGIMDSYFPEASFFTEYERFERFVEKRRLEDSIYKIDYISICSPNYLHDSHIRAAIRLGASVICEKPLVINPWNLDYLHQFELENPGQKINTVLQLRLHETIKGLKERVERENKQGKYDIELTYITSRGLWYDYSWKGDEAKSGGITTNIGIHFFDMLLWIFGGVEQSIVYKHDMKQAAGYLELEKARVKWYLSLNRKDLPEENKEGNRAFRLIKVDGHELEFSEGFTDLHTEVYRKTLAGNGFSIHDARPSLELIHMIRNSKPAEIPNDPFFREKLKVSSHITERNVGKSCVIAESASIGIGTHLGNGVVIEDGVVIGEGCVIGNNVTIYKGSRIGSNVRIDDATVVGKQPMKAVTSDTTQGGRQLENARISDGCLLGTNVVIYAGCTIGSECLIADYASVREDVRIGEKTIVGRNVTVENKVNIGSRCKIQSNVHLVPYTTIEDDVFIAPGVKTSNDNYLGRTEKRKSEYGGATVRRGARLGVGCVILPNIEIGEDALVGAGSVVTKNVPPRTIVYGTPARPVRSVPYEELLENQ